MTITVLVQDLRFALRTLTRSPGYALVVILALALGIGATTAVYSVVDGVILRPLPYAEPDRLLVVSSSHPQGGSRIPPSYLDWRDWQDRARTFAQLGFARGDALLLQGTDDVRRVLTAFVSEGFLTMLGTQPLHGRTFTPDEQRGAGERVVVLGHGLWTEQFGADREILGRTIRLSGEPYTIVGIMPPGFRAPDFAQMWTPLAPHLASDPGVERRAWRVDNRVFGRLAVGATQAHAVDEMNRISARLAAEHPETNEEWGVALTPLREEVIGNAGSLLGILLGASAVVLLIACFNVANLALVRATARGREMALRASLGAGRGRLVRQLLVESVLLAAAGGVLGVLLAWWGVEALIGAAPGILPRLEEVSIDARVLAVSALVVLGTTMIFGTAPAVRATRLDLSSALRAGSAGAGGAGRGARRARSALVVTQLALALVLLVSAGLLLRSFANLLGVDPGFTIERLVTVRVLPPAERNATPKATLALYDRLRERIEALPGVASVALINHLPLAASGVATELRVPGRARTEQGAANASFRTVTAGYFETMEIALRAGRPLREVDMSPSSDAIVVNETLANALWPGEVAVGKSLTVFKQAVGRPDFRQPIEGRVVGVVADSRPFGPDRQAVPEVFIPFERNPWASAYLAIRTRGNASAAVPPVRRTIMAVDGDLPLDDLSTMEQRMGERVAQRRLTMMLLGTFAAVALALAAIGIYGIVAYSVTQRTREIGVRMALGAEPRRVLRLVLGEGVLLGVIGVLIGMAIALGATRLLSGMLFEVEPLNPPVFVAVAALLVAVTAAASLIPALRAASVDPVRALRTD